MADVLAIIPFYKQRAQLDQCLSCLRASTYSVEPFVVDNNVENKGFTKACNIGLREAMRRGHRYAILLNQDCYVQPDTVQQALDFMDAHPKCAIAGPKQLAATDTDLIIHGGCEQAFPVGRHITGRRSLNDCSKSLPMPWVNGACMVVRVEALYEIGLMDEGFFLIASDADFCFVARQRRWQVWYCAEAVVLHEVGGVSSRQSTLGALAHFNADQLYFRDKWIGSMGWACLQNTPPAPGAALAHSDMEVMLQNAVQHFHRNDLVQAEILSRRVLDFEPENASAVLILARVHIELGAPASAARALLNIIDRVPDSAQTCVALADALFMCNFWEECIPHYTRARTLGFNTAELCNNLGLALAQVGHTSQAVGAWREALALDPCNKVALDQLERLGLR
jgi:GT2 family glycosyltransferase/Flp pilus assembly protein TadD